MTQWTEHVKEYASKNGVSYKDAMTSARSTYTKVAPKTTKTSEPKEPKEPKTTKPKVKSNKPTADMLKKGEVHDQIKGDYEKSERVESAKKISKKKPTPLMM
tara:strand:+ start:126 stop:431 length:306 start_codon:yes stop_codon:yes gene_type:complete